MKICIVTLYRTDNSGSYWQAKALGEVVAQLGHQVCYYKVNYISKLRVRDYLGLAKRIVTFDFCGGVRRIRSMWGFVQKRKELNVISEKKIEKENVDCYILGSDTIWNLDDNYIAKNADVFWGERFFGTRVATYAASVANISLEKCLQIKNIAQIISQWSMIGVRDSHTKAIISSLTDSPVEIVCDPTLLLTKSEYKKWAQRLYPNRYVFLYLFEKMSSRQIYELVSFCKKNNLSIINGLGSSYKIQCCDVQAINTPNDFLSHMYYAEFVITDTFHGTVFSVNLQKDFVVINREKKKVNDFLDQIEFGERLIKSKDSFLDILEDKIDYVSKNKIVDSFRKKSLEYLAMTCK